MTLHCRMLQPSYSPKSLMLLFPCFISEYTVSITTYFQRLITLFVVLQQVNPASHQLSCLASATLAKCAFLCTVLAENLEHFHLAFCVGMFGLEMARPPASTKPLEVSTRSSEQVNKLVRTLKKKLLLTLVILYQNLSRKPQNPQSG